MIYKNGQNKFVKKLNEIAAKLTKLLFIIQLPKVKFFKKIRHKCLLLRTWKRWDSNLTDWKKRGVKVKISNSKGGTEFFSTAAFVSLFSWKLRCKFEKGRRLHLNSIRHFFFSWEEAVSLTSAEPDSLDSRKMVGVQGSLVYLITAL